MNCIYVTKVYFIIGSKQIFLRCLTCTYVRASVGLNPMSPVMLTFPNTFFQCILVSNTLFLMVGICRACYLPIEMKIVSIT